MGCLYSIGHGNKSIKTFIHELRSFGVTFLVDVRSSPWSKHNPQYRKDELREHMSEAGITYVWLGKQLGGRPEDPELITDGKPDYQKIVATDEFQAGLQRLITAAEKDLKLAFMCAEADPKDCHRSHLIAPELERIGVEVHHIVSLGLYKDQATVIEESGKNQGNIFEEK